jgi:hypothetical protein
MFVVELELEYQPDEDSAGGGTVGSMCVFFFCTQHHPSITHAITHPFLGSARAIREEISPDAKRMNQHYDP